MQYTVRAGDSLTKIARDQLGDMALWQEIALRNGIKGPDYTIQVGQVLELTDDKAVEASQQSRGAGTVEDPRRFTTGLTITATPPVKKPVSRWVYWLLIAGGAAVVYSFFFPPKPGGMFGLAPKRRKSRGRSRGMA